MSLRETFGSTALAIAVACMHGRVAHAAANYPAALPDSCTAALLAQTPPYDTTRVLDLVGRYRWVWKDTVSNRNPGRYPPALRRAGKPRLRQIQLWEVDTGAVRANSSLWLQRRKIGRVAGAIVGDDTTGFGPTTPQLEVVGAPVHHLSMVYDQRVWHGLLDGGDVADDVPIQVAGSWGFGGYYERHSQFYIKDLDGKRIPSFAGFYCAIRITQSPRTDP